MSTVLIATSFKNRTIQAKFVNEQHVGCKTAEAVNSIIHEEKINWDMSLEHRKIHLHENKYEEEKAKIIDIRNRRQNL